MSEEQLEQPAPSKAGEVITKVFNYFDQDGRLVQMCLPVDGAAGHGTSDNVVGQPQFFGHGQRAVMMPNGQQGIQKIRFQIAAETVAEAFAGVDETFEVACKAAKEAQGRIVIPQRKPPPREGLRGMFGSGNGEGL